MLLLGAPLLGLGAHGEWKARSLREKGRETLARVIRKWEEHGSAWRGRFQASASFVARRIEIRYLDDAGKAYRHVLALTDDESVLWKMLRPGSEVRAVYATNHPAWACVPGTREGQSAVDPDLSRGLLALGSAIFLLGAAVTASGLRRTASRRGEPPQEPTRLES